MRCTSREEQMRKSDKDRRKKNLSSGTLNGFRLVNQSGY